MKKLSLCIVAILVMVACGNKTDKASGNNESLAADAASVDDSKHNEVYISQRIDSIYSHFGYKPFNPDAPIDNINYDSLFCTDSYLALSAEAQKVSEETGEIWIDADHWIVGQDISEDWSYKIKKIDILSDSTATVELNVHNFNDERVILDLLFQRGDWFVDNFHFFYTDDDGKVSEINEQEEARNFINPNP